MNILIKDIDLSDDNTIYIKKIDGKYYARHSHVMGFSSEVEPFSTVNKDSLIGEWMYGENDMADCVDGYYCSLCDFFVPWDYKHKSIDFIKEYNYCPNCGRKMIIKE